ncbi:MAG: Minf_1886 family protein [Gemmatimonadales bacterium]
MSCLDPVQLRYTIESIESRYAPQAYLLMLAALESCQQRREVRGHISGEDLAWACRDFAREHYGLMARTVLSHWGVETTEDMGEIVFGLIEAGLLIRDTNDRKENFNAVFDFEGAFDLEYPWSGVSQTVDLGLTVEHW